MSEIKPKDPYISLLQLIESLAKRDNEIERLECALTISQGKHENAIAEIERLRSIVQGAMQKTTEHEVRDILDEAGIALQEQDRGEPHHVNEQDRGEPSR